jgi:hypothetical protein
MGWFSWKGTPWDLADGMGAIGAKHRSDLAEVVVQLQLNIDSC